MNSSTARLSRCLLLATFLGGSALAQTYQMSLDAGTVELGGGLTVPMPGQGIGDFDKETNPEGTLTLPGLFGGSGNRPFSLSLELGAGLELDGTPAGEFQLTLDQGSLLATLDGLELDLLGSGVGSLDLTVTLEFETFRTFNPDSLFIGGFPLPIPLGAIALDAVTFTQSASTTGLLIPAGSGYDVLFLVPGALSLSLDLLGTPFELEQLPAVLPFGGRLEPSSSGLTFSVTASGSSDETLAEPGIGLEEIPLPVPTLLPPGGVANLLWSGEAAELGLALDYQLELEASGAGDCSEENFCEGLVNSTGSGATIASNGELSVAANKLSLSASPVPTDTTAIFFYSAARSNGGVGEPFGSGLRCVGSPGIKSFRLEWFSAAGSTAAFPVDLDRPVEPAGLVLPGSTWHFQCYYLDSSQNGSGFNTSDALTITFCP